jgi:2-polyprenyl-3-methyl-5-hydroxy-6-metoxy-1,4-benzoquinol methylase
MLSEIEPLNLTIESETDVKYSDEYIYKKPWNKLNSIHKIIKVKEFVNNLHSDDIEMKKNLKIKLVNMIKERKITKKTDINYDMVNGNIISIPILQYVNNKYIV